MNEEKLQRTYMAAIQEMLEDTEEIMAAVQDSAGLVLQPQNQAEMAQVEQAIIELQNQVLELHKAKQRRSIGASDYTGKLSEYSQQLQELEAQQAALQATENRYSEVKLWLDTFSDHIQSGEIMNTEDGVMLKQLVEQILIYNDYMEIHFKCGVTVKHDYV